MSDVKSFISGMRAGQDIGAPLANAMRDRRLHQMRLEMMEREWEHDREGWAWQSRDKALDREVSQGNLDVRRDEFAFEQTKWDQEARGRKLDDQAQSLANAAARIGLQRSKAAAQRANVPPAMIGIEQTADVLAARRSEAEARLQAALAANDKRAALRAQAVLKTYDQLDANFSKDPLATSASLWGQGRTFDFTQKLPDGSTIKGKIPAGNAETLTAADLIEDARAQQANPAAAADPMAAGLQTQATSKLKELGAAKADLLMMQADGAQKVKADAAGGYAKAGWLGGTPIQTELQRITTQESHLRNMLGQPQPAAAAAPSMAPAPASPADYFGQTSPGIDTNDVQLRGPQGAAVPPRQHPTVPMVTTTDQQRQNWGMSGTQNLASTLPRQIDAGKIEEAKAWLHANMNAKDPQTKAKVEAIRAALVPLARQEAMQIQ